jgi:DNA-binding transcriptional ArsR family regulator
MNQIKYSQALAQDVGPQGAMVLSYFARGIDHHKANRHNGKYWYFCSGATVSKYFENMLSPAAMSALITKLVRKGYLIARKDPKVHGRTLSYAFTSEDVYQEALKGKMIWIQSAEAQQFGNVNTAAVFANIIYWIMQGRISQPDLCSHEVATDRLAKLLGLSKNTVINSLTKLVETGVLTVEKRSGMRSKYTVVAIDQYITARKENYTEYEPRVARARQAAQNVTVQNQEITVQFQETTVQNQETYISNRNISEEGLLKKETNVAPASLRSFKRELEELFGKSVDKCLV